MKQAIRIGGYIGRGLLPGASTAAARLVAGRTPRPLLSRPPSALVGAATSSRHCVRHASTASAVAEDEDPVDFEEEEEVSQGPILRPYQEACVQECLANLAAGISRIGVSSPTGSGKVRSVELKVDMHITDAIVLTSRLQSSRPCSLGFPIYPTRSARKALAF